MISSEQEGRPERAPGGGPAENTRTDGSGDLHESSTGGQAVRRRLSPPARRAQLIDAAAGLFTRYGGRFTSSQLAAEAGVSEGTVFRYFPDMSSLMKAARRQAVGLDELLPELRAAHDLPDLRDRLREAGNALIQRIVETARLIEASGVAKGHAPHAEIDEVFDALTPLFDGFEVATISKRQQTAMFLGLLVSGTLFSASFSPAGVPPGSDPVLQVDQIVDVFLDGMTSVAERSPRDTE